MNNKKLYKNWGKKLKIMNIQYINYKIIKKIIENNKIKITHISTMNNLFNIKIFKQVNY